MYRVVRFAENPIIHPQLDDTIGPNINGPSLIRVPDWVANPLGRFYLYFAHHQGTYIRMAYADDIRGSWVVFPGGVLDLANTSCRHHIASPDVHVMVDRREIVMYFHGVTTDSQRTFRATSKDGLHFDASSLDLGPFYFRALQHDGAWYAMAKTTESPGGGLLMRSPDGKKRFERGPDIIPEQRHTAVLEANGTLQIFFSRGEDCPERILVSTMGLPGDWRDWRPSEPIEVMRPETEYEGGELPLRPSRFGSIHEPVRELRDPAIFRDQGKLYLLYSGAGESVICGAELFELS